MLREGKMKRFTVAILVILPSLALAACGTTPGCRAVSTGALGAGTGAAIAAIAGGPIALGALVGGATGAFGGVATPPQAAYLGPSPVCY
jgi:osmotically inducible lipoprotein OsmB